MTATAIATAAAAAAIATICTNPTGKCIRVCMCIYVCVCCLLWQHQSPAICGNRKLVSVKTRQCAAICNNQQSVQHNHMLPDMRTYYIYTYVYTYIPKYNEYKCSRITINAHLYNLHWAMLCCQLLFLLLLFV